MSNGSCHESDAGGAGHIVSERNRYFTGKYLSARDFSGEQAYFLSHHRLHNRVLHGWGIVCGLRVVPHPDEHCRKRWVVVRGGIAIDCYGREIVLPKDVPFELPLPSSVGAETPHVEAGVEAALPPPLVAHRYLLCIKHTEELIEHVPALYSEGLCDPSRREANRVREVGQLVVLDPAEHPNCWRHQGAPHDDPDKQCRDDCDEELPGPGGICLEPECPCGDTVPLALIEYVPGHHQHPLHIDMSGRRTLRTPPEFLTKIVGTNWRHGGTISMDYLRNAMHGRLEVYFDRKIRAADGDATGVNPFTFVVEYRDIQQDLEAMPPDADHPPHLVQDCRAAFTIEPGLLHGKHLTLANHVVYVTLHCEFILDCHGNAVDGCFMGARFPTGNGVPGSTFRSWFWVR